jgi:hypothetical protein
VDDERLRALIETIIDTHGGVVDRSGHAGVAQAKIDAFFADAAALDAWHRKGEASEGALPLAAYDPAASAPSRPCPLRPVHVGASAFGSAM